jgi:hypothetical protein
MLPVNDLGSDSPLYFSLLEHPCDYALKCIDSLVVTLALWFRAQSRCPQPNHRPCVWVETGTRTNPSTERCSAKCSPSASESPREWIQLRQSTRQFQLHPDRQLTNRAAHRRTNLRGKLNSLSRELAASLLSHKSAACVVVAVHMLSTSHPHSTITTVFCSAFKCRTRRKECTSDLSLSGVPLRGQQGKSDQLRRSTPCLKAGEQ